MGKISQFTINPQRREVRTAFHKGEFWKPCPGTSDDYLCCGYEILTPMTGCGMYCRYCVLQVYFDNQYQTVFENFDDLEREVCHKMEMPEYKNKVVRIGTGEFGDSLFLENRFGLSEKVAALFDRYHNVLVEFKTKSANIYTLSRIKNPQKIVVGFSLNTETIVNQLESGTAPVVERLKAARRCVEMGFSVAFHFDPVVWYDRWEGEYRQTISMIYDYIGDAGKIAWCSMGGFRCMPPLKSKLHRLGMDLPLFAGEMVLGADGKLRYPRPLRAGFYRAMDDEFKKHQPDAPLYLCMESREVWEECGMSNGFVGAATCRPPLNDDNGFAGANCVRQPLMDNMRNIDDTLTRFLNRRAESILGI